MGMRCLAGPTRKIKERKEMKPCRRWLYITLVIVSTSKQVQAEKVEKQEMECSNNKAVQGVPGGQLTLSSKVDLLERCYFVATDNNGGQCCYNRIGYGEDCDSSEMYTVRDKTNCLKENITYEINLDWEETGTCNITILNLSGAATGQYKSYNADDQPLNEHGCFVTVTEQGNSVLLIIGVVMVVAVLIIALVVVQIKFKIIKKAGPQIPENAQQLREPLN